MKTYISVNIVSQALILIAAIKKNQCDCLQKISQIKLPYGINRDAAMSFLCQCGLLTIKDDKVSFTEIGESIAVAFNGFCIYPALWRTILAEYVYNSAPAWAQRIPYGRKEAYLIMTTEEQRCFDEAGLMESTDSEVVEWWDGLADYIREKRNMSNINIGRNGERYTLMYEQNRTGIVPDWISIESNVAGYDILSRKTNTSDERILIEVKTSSKPINDAVCFITRHEWEIATQKSNINRYFFYLWKISKGEVLLAIVDTSRMQLCLPIDSGAGKWTDVSVPYAAFEDLFVRIKTNNDSINVSKSEIITL